MNTNISASIVSFPEHLSEFHRESCDSLIALLETLCASSKHPRICREKRKVGNFEWVSNFFVPGGFQMSIWKSVSNKEDPWSSMVLCFLKCLFILFFLVRTTPKIPGLTIVGVQRSTACASATMRTSLLKAKRAQPNSVFLLVLQALQVFVWIPA